MHISQNKWEALCGGGAMASDVGGAECVVLVGGDIDRDLGVFADVLGSVDPLRTIERYVSAILGPGLADDGLVCVVVFSSCSDERTNGTRLRRIPAPKTRWSSSGRK